ncbi:MAG: 3-hydroxyacyl-ACP dehydratase FabZ [Leptospiraceae bacterium]|nr:3-hydroxyacyl-ACP dehydratase FabZ [Leptospiraceae bacterium]MCP5495531.1 3-hydroxyacyl-ACP dehydratase FabZ [Leptospiraceae bacterium]
MRFLLIDKITSWNLGKSANAVKNVSLSEDFFDDHFPMKPIMPGVLILEGMAQLSGLLVEETVRAETKQNPKALMSKIENAKFRVPVYPGDVLHYEATIESVNELGAKTSVKAYVLEKVVAQCSILFSFHQIDNPTLESHRSKIISQWMRDLNK